MRMRGRAGVAIGAALGMLVFGAALASADLTTFGYGNSRLGTAPANAGVAPTRARKLQPVWRAKIGGAINSQTLVVDGLRINGHRHNVAFVASEHGDVVAVDTAHGAILWRRHVGTRSLIPDCGATSDGRFGVTGTMVVDKPSGRLYAVDVNGLAWAFSLTDGRVAAGWPIRVHPRGPDFVWGALAIAAGKLYVPIASLCDSGRYRGGVAAVDLAHPTRVINWQTTSAPVYGGGIWGWGGVSIDGTSGDVYAATGNAIGGASEADGDGESVVRLSPTLEPREGNTPLAPPFKVYDRDFGTTPVLIDAKGCPPLLVAINKVGALYVYERGDLAAGPTQTLMVAADSPDGIPLYGMPAYDAATRTLVLVSPTTPSNSPLRAGVQAFALTNSCQFALKWQQKFDPPDAGSAPTIAGGVVYIGSGRNGWLQAFRLTDGARLWGRYLAGGTIFAAPAVDGGTVYVGTWSGELVALRPRR